MTEERREELKPCPFCGEAVRFGDRYEGTGIKPATNYPCIICEPCGYIVDFGMRSQHRMKQKWNTRARQGASAG